MNHPLLDQAIDKHRAGQLDEAEQNYRAALAETPHQPDALALLGVLLDGKGRHQEAVGLIEEAIELDSDAAIFKFYLGNALMAAGDAERAAAAFREAISLQPDLPEVHFNLGNALAGLGRWGDALAAYKQALQLAPGHAEARNNMALIHQRQGRLAEAISELQRTVADKPAYAEAWLNLCKLAEKNGDCTLSLEAGRQAVGLMPQNASAYLNLGVALNRLGRHEEVEHVYKIAISLRPDWTEAWDNLGLTLQFMNQLEDAEAAFRKTIELAGQAIPDDAVRTVEEHTFGARHWHLAQLELMKGDYARGFGRYRCRFTAAGGLKRPDLPQPFWRGEDIKGKTILVFDEEGRGDGLMMCRYLPLLKERGARVKFHVQPSFGPLFKGWDGADEIIVAGESLGDFDLYTWMFDLPYAFGTTLETVPARMPYLPLLSADKDWCLGPAKQPRIGVIWAGSAADIHDKRCIPFDIFSSLFETGDCEFYSLARDKRAGDGEKLARLPVIDLAPRMRDFGDLARFVMQMDLVISCDTAVPQLAGGLGKPVWTLLPFSSDWRWLTNREDSPWYPSMRLFRQEKTGDWEGLIKKTKAALQDWLARHGKC